MINNYVSVCLELKKNINDIKRPSGMNCMHEN